MTTIINLYSGPGGGKSTIAAALFGKMKSNGYSVELLSEYAKECFYENKTFTVNDQIYVLGKMFHKFYMLNNKIDYIISDSPILLSIIYFRRTPLYNVMSYDIYQKFVLELYNVFNKTVNLIINRNYDITFEKNGRYHNVDESVEIDSEILTLLKDNNIKYQFISNYKNNIEKTVDEIMDKI